MKSLLDLYSAHQGKVSIKWSLYLVEYDRIFSGFRDQPLSMLEIGIQNGGSLEIWSDYFLNAQFIVGCDFNQDCEKLTFQDQRIRLVIGDINSDEVEKEILKHSKKFDLIIDDGSHTSKDIVKSFSRYFRNLNEGGLYIVEDLHCSYWREYEGGLYYPYSSMAFFKRLADVMNHEHWGVQKERRQLLEGFSKKFSIEFTESDLQKIHSIEFFNSVCIVRKCHSGSNILEEKLTAGQNELVVPGHLKLKGVLRAPPQENNEWAVMSQAPEEAWPHLLERLSERDSQIAKLNQEVSELHGQLERLSERDSQIAKLNQEVSELHGQIAKLNKIIYEIYRSKSWLVTAPLRKVSEFFKRILK